MQGTSGGKQKTFFQNLLVFSITLLIGLALTEVILRFVSPPVITGVGTTDTPKAKIYGWVPPPNTQIRQGNPDTGEVFSFKTNSQGWKDIEHSFEKPAGVFRILVLGDSHTYGVVPLESLFTRLVEKKLKEKGFSQVEVISIGVGAWGADQKLEALENEGVKYSPDIVIYQFCGNDIGDDLVRTSWLSGSKPFYYELDQNGAIKKNVTDVHKSAKVFSISGLLNKSALFYNLNNAIKKIRGHRNAPGMQEHFQAAEKDVKAIIEERIAENKNLRYPANLNAFVQMYMESALDPQSAYFVYAKEEHNEEVRKGWLLLEALILRMKDVSEKNKAEFIIFSEEGENGKRLWNLKWKYIHNDGNLDFLVRNGVRYPIDWSRPLKDLMDITKRHGIRLIAPKSEYKRFEYDNHPNAAGNQSIAKDISEYLINESSLRSIGLKVNTK